jgi:hypothetical protein
VREFLDRIRGKRFVADPESANPGLQHDWQARLSKIEAELRALDETKQDKGPYLQAHDLHDLLRIGGAPKLDAEQFAPRSEVDSRITTLTTRIEAIRQRIQQVAESKGGFFQGLSFGKLIVGALGLSGPLAGAVIVAGGLAGRRAKKSRLDAARMLGAAERALDPVAVDTPPPPQRTVPETHYVSVEKDSFAKAHQWASEHVARKYPGATEILQAQDSLIKQYLAAK